MNRDYLSMMVGLILTFFGVFSVYAVYTDARSEKFCLVKNNWHCISYRTETLITYLNNSVQVNTQEICTQWKEK